MPPELQGKPVARKLSTASLIEVNKATHESFFRLEPHAGTIVIDTSLPISDESGNTLTPKPTSSGVVPSVSYVQPANPTDVEKVAKLAQERFRVLGSLPPAPTRGSYQRLFIVVNAIVLTCLCILGIRRHLRRSSQPG
jgi:hypothetical protein